MGLGNSELLRHARQQPRGAGSHVDGLGGRLQSPSFPAVMVQCTRLITSPMPVGGSTLASKRLRREQPYAPVTHLPALCILSSVLDHISPARLLGLQVSATTRACLVKLQ